MTISEARAALPDVVRRVGAGEEVTITRHGQPVAVVVRPDALRARRADALLAGAAAVRDEIDRGRRSRLAVPTITADRAEELVAGVRRDRGRHGRP